MKNRLRAFFAFLGFPNLFSKDYTCSSCGFVWPKATAQKSGDAGYPQGIHVHCPKCAAVIAQHLKPRN